MFIVNKTNRFCMFLQSQLFHLFTSRTSDLTTIYVELVAFGASTWVPFCSLGLPFNSLWAPFGLPFGSLWVVFAPLGVLLGLPGAILGSPWAHWSLPWVHLGPPWTHLDALWDPLGSILSMFSSHDLILTLQWTIWDPCRHQI